MLTTDNSKICGPNGETLWDHVGRLKIIPFLVLIIFPLTETSDACPFITFDNVRVYARDAETANLVT